MGKILGADYRVTRIAEGTYHVLDSGDSSWYIVEGEDKVAVIDTGIVAGNKIMPVIRELTDKPAALIITHAHIDHLHHMDEFDEVYMCHDEFKMGEEILQSHFAGKDLDLSKTINIDDDSVVTIGGLEFEICKVPGHTPGSVVVLDKKNNFLYTGDAIGSGYGVWMQVPGGVPLAQYYQSLVHMVEWLVARGGRMKFFGGHNYQQFQSTLIPNWNPLGMGLLCDLVDLVDGIVKGTIVGRASNADKAVTLEPPLYASYGRAEIQYSPTNIKSRLN